MKKAVILHGTMGSPEGNWLRWLGAELSTRGIEVWLPTLPHADKPRLSEWVEYVQHNAPFPIDEQTIVIGHSSGAILGLIVAQKSKISLGAVIAVSVFHDNSLNWEANNQLFDVPFDFKAIKNNTEKLVFIHSDNDPYVPLEQAQYVSQECGGEMIIIPGQGHFNLEQSKNYTKFPKLIELLRERSLL